MANILHRIGIKTPSMDEVYRALTTRDGLAGWWTTDTRGEGDQAGNTVIFRFGTDGFDMKVTNLQSPGLVEWEVVDGPQEWIGTTIRFGLKQEGDYVILLFKHLDWKEPVEFMHHCSTKWAVFLMSLKSLVETGKGRPFPDDVKVDNWN
ncbi:SRPBCC domain-containing protein [Chitinophaga oryzae]|uniref:SRPBCC domain-containing protein n=1 Tax=Chitinophaga oryzae TaxID=2725414 RepID=A0AAE7DAX9_9BACT|nr:SRPBCC domain-containing protein [Chitinophaga oryzae]QJB35898.1 SRPBCC domain-containing protein [Chitinophaga oryzae]